MQHDHPDFQWLNQIRFGIISKAGGEAKLLEQFPVLVRDAIEYVIDPVRTARTTIAELDNVEKTFVGLKIEHFIRDFLDVPKGVRDLVIDGEDVDVKNTVGVTWMIPRETYNVEGPCLLICIADAKGRCWLGLILAREAYLGAPNQDKKRGVSAFGRKNILWLADGVPFARNHWAGLNMDRFRELRSMDPGAVRAATFFQENLNKRVHRNVIQSLLWDQADYMKRLRENGGARDILRPLGIILLGGRFGSQEASQLGLAPIGRDEMMAVRTR